MGKIIVKAEGRAFGKGVLITDSQPEAVAWIATILDTTHDMEVVVRQAKQPEG